MPKYDDFDLDVQVDLNLNDENGQYEQMSTNWTRFCTRGCNITKNQVGNLCEA